MVTKSSKGGIERVGHVLQNVCTTVVPDCNRCMGRVYLEQRDGI